MNKNLTGREKCLQGIDEYQVLVPKYLSRADRPRIAVGTYNYDGAFSPNTLYNADGKWSPWDRGQYEAVGSPTASLEEAQAAKAACEVLVWEVVSHWEGGNYGIRKWSVKGPFPKWQLMNRGEKNPPKFFSSEEEASLEASKRNANASRDWHEGIGNGLWR